MAPGDRRVVCAQGLSSETSPKQSFSQLRDFTKAILLTTPRLHQSNPSHKRTSGCEQAEWEDNARSERQAQRMRA